MAEDNQALTVKVGKWLYQNRDKEGTPEYTTAVSTYKKLSSGSTQAPEKSYDLAEIPSAMGANASADASGAWESVKQGVSDAVETVKTKSVFSDGFQGFGFPTNPIDANKAKDEVVGEGKRLYDKYGSYDKAKRALAEHPITTALDVAGYAVPALKGGTAAVKAVPQVARGLKKLNASKVEYPEVAGDVARDLKLNHETGDYNLPRFAGDETKQATNKLHTNYKTEIDTDYATIKHLLDPKDAVDDANRLKRVEAEKAFRSGDHLRMDKSLRSEIAAVAELVGHTKEGTRIVNNLKKQVEVGRLGSKVKGGLSQFTDELNPLSTGSGRFGVKGLPQVFTAAQLGAAPLMGGVNLAAQGAAVTTGRLVDLLTKRGNLPRKYMKDNKDAPASPSTDGLVDVAQTTREAKVLAEQEARLAKAEAIKKSLESKVEKVKDSQAKTEAKNTFKEALDEDRYRTRAKKALEALNKKNAPKETKAPKETYGISSLAIRAVNKVMAKKAMETSSLKEATEKASRVEATAKASGEPTVRSQVRDTVLYNAGIARITAQQSTVSGAINATKLPSLKSTLKSALDDLQKPDAKGKKNHKRRVEIYEEALAKAKTSHERSVIKDKLHPLAFTFSGKK